MTANGPGHDPGGYVNTACLAQVSKPSRWMKNHKIYDLDVIFGQYVDVLIVYLALVPQTGKYSHCGTNLRGE